MSFKYFLNRIYWKLIYWRKLREKILKAMKTPGNVMNLESDLWKLLAEWRRLREKYDGAEYDQKGYWIH